MADFVAEVGDSACEAALTAFDRGPAHLGIIDRELPMHHDRSRTAAISRRLGNLTSTAFPPRSARWNEEMDERSARRNQETGCHDGPSRSFREPAWMRADTHE